MLLSIIIVNYNVKYFLEQCLCSVRKALQAAGMDLEGGHGRSVEDGVGGPEEGGEWRGASGEVVRAAEIFVVDNASSDGSADWLPPRFPGLQFILNPDNRGFAAANNQALSRATGKYILFLNPDSILPEDAFSVCLSFMDSHPEAGAAGLRMIDGSGHYLKESRRGFPTPWVAFCKLSGLTTLFPKSAIFAGYYLGHRVESATHPAPILSGAFMFVRKEALDRIGDDDDQGIVAEGTAGSGRNNVAGFDERFFLYAEDIDLSFRLEQAGYTNYYIADTTILHFKGESTRRDARYVRLFYKAMSQFRRKYSGRKDRNRGWRLGSWAFNALLELGIWGRGAIEAMRNWRLGDPRPQPVKNQKEAEEIILYEGKENSFKEIIATIEASAASSTRTSMKAISYKIHASGSAAAVGSPSKKQQGDVIVMEKGKEERQLKNGE
jgi:N-acetylglucosaminyl-diphospho-decaprenol L-rhamnosyltransferase